MKVEFPLANTLLAPLGITAAASAIDTGSQKKIHGSWTTTLIISNEEMNDLMTLVQPFEHSNILLKGLTKTIKNETKDQKGEFLSILLDTLGESLLKRNKKGKEIVRVGYGNKIVNIFSMPPHPLTNVEIQNCYQNEPRFNGIFSRDNLPKK